MKTGLFRKKYLAAAAAIFALSAGAYAQTPVRTVQVSSIDVNVLGVSIGFEQPLGGTFSFVGRLGLQTGLAYAWNMFGENKFGYSVNGAISVEPRWYYNFRRRLIHGRSIRGNSGGFLSTEVMYLTPPLTRDGLDKAQGFMITPMWGVRKVWPSHIFWEFSAGIEIYFMSWEEAPFTDNSAGPRISVRIGYAF